jgi:MFS family permease
VTIKARLPPRQTNFFLLSAFKDTKYDLIVLGTFFLLIGTFAPLFFIPTYAVSRGIDATLAGYLLAILNAASTFGRIIPGILADKFGRINMLGIGGVLTGVTIFCLNSAVSTAALVVYSLAIGFISGSIISGASAALSFCAKDPRDIGTYLGMGYAVGSIAALIGPPINGVLLNHYDGFFPVSAFSGVACLIGGFIVFGSKAAAPEGLLGKL